MPTVAIHPPSGLTSTAGHGTTMPSHQQQPRPALRRAVYIHVSDVLTNAYNIDHAKLEEELTRVRNSPNTTLSSPGLAGVFSGVGSSQSSTPGSAATTETSALDRSLPADMVDTTAGGTGTVPTHPKRLNPPRGGFNLCVLVGNVQVVVDKKRVDGSRVRLAEVEVGDETGTVSLRARDEQIDLLMHVSQQQQQQAYPVPAVVLRNCTLELYQGKHIRLAITKWGKLSLYPDSVPSTPPPPSKMNLDRNFSLIDLSLVARETATSTASAPVAPTALAFGSSAAGGSRPATTTMQQQQQQPTSSPSMAAYEGGGRGAGRRGSRNFQQQPPPQHSSMLHPYNELVGGVGGGGAMTGMRYGGYPTTAGYAAQNEQEYLQHHHHSGFQHHRYGPPPQQAMGRSRPGGDAHPPQQQQQQPPPPPREQPQIFMQGQYDHHPQQQQPPPPQLHPMYQQHPDQAHAAANLFSVPSFEQQQRHLSAPSPPPGGYRTMNPQAATFDPSMQHPPNYSLKPPPPSSSSSS